MQIVGKYRSILQSCLIEVEQNVYDNAIDLPSAINAIFSSKFYQRGLNDCIFSLVSLQFSSFLRLPALEANYGKIEAMVN
jgi:hypothetical protein